MPPGDRVSHQGVLALPLADRELGAALVQYQASEATVQGELDQARVLVMGDSTMLWLAQDIVGCQDYPEEAVPAYAGLAPLVRRVLRAEDPQVAAAMAELTQAAGDALPEPVSARILATVEQLRAGSTPEQLRGGTAGHESGVH
jgi:hypothetical protein